MIRPQVRMLYDLWDSRRRMQFSWDQSIRREPEHKQKLLDKP